MCDLGSDATNSNMKVVHAKFLERHAIVEEDRYSWIVARYYDAEVF